MRSIDLGVHTVAQLYKEIAFWKKPRLSLAVKTSEFQSELKVEWLLIFSQIFFETKVIIIEIIGSYIYP